MKGRRLTLVTALSSSDRPAPDGVWFTSPPLGILTLAAKVRTSYQVQVIDLDLLFRDAGENPSAFRRLATSTIAASKPDTLGFGSASGSYPTTIALAEQVSHELPGVPILVGGPQASVVDVYTLEAFPFVDFILRGEADLTYPQLLDALARQTPLADVPGLTYRANGLVRRNPNAPVILDLDELPLPAFDLYPGGLAGLASISIEAGRGCPFACRFCSTNDFFRRRFRLKSAKRILADMRQLDETYGIKLFDLVHDMFTVDRRKVVEFCELLIEVGSPYGWSCAARTDCVDSDLLKLMQKAGCQDLFFGIETGSQRLQRVIDKNLDLEEARRVLAEADGLGITATASLITGFPEETKEDFRSTIQFFCDTIRYSHIFPKLYILSPLAETPLTTQYWDQLYLHPDWRQIAEDGLGQDASEAALITANKAVFPNFYNFPSTFDPAFLRRARDFLFFGFIRCDGLIEALYRCVPDMIALFEAFDCTYGPRSPKWFVDDEFPQALVQFALARHGDNAAVATMGRFYQAVFQPSAAHGKSPASITEPWLTLCRGVRVIRCVGDVNAVWQALRQGVEPAPELKDRPVAVVLRTMALNRAEIFEFPPLTLEIVSCAERHASIGQVVNAFTARGVTIAGLSAAQVVEGAIRILEEKQLVRRMIPQPVESASTAVS